MRRFHAWLIPIVLLGVATSIEHQITALPDRIGGWLSSYDRPQDRAGDGPDFSASVDLIRLNDEGRSAVTPGDFRPSAKQTRLLADPGAAASPGFTALLRSAGAVNLETLTLRLTLTGRRAEKVNILDIQPVSVRRSDPLAGTLFDAPPQGGSDTSTVLLDLDRPFPIVRRAVFSAEDDSLKPGPPFFARQTIVLAHREQHVVVLRATSLRYYVAFRLRVTYMVGDRQKHTVIDDRGRPFQVTGLKQDPDSYRRVFTFGKHGLSFCQSSGPDENPSLPCDEE
ncbi:hypothetical protein OG828_08665 [Streptomyces sp. NBC_00457]|uniref:hypothetical protein n=1 Tax=Streptomyces sp. NBC_00457 TaxID=2975748 RepID=UPI002E1E3C9F